MTIEPVLPTTLMDPPRGRGAAPAPPSDLAVQAHGVDLTRLLHRRAHAQVVEGWTTLSGQWREGGLVVDSQRTGPSGTTARREPDWVVPPCPEPPGGWPAGGEVELPPSYASLLDAGVVAAATVFRPPGRGPVLVVTAHDVAVAEHALRPVLGPRLCLVRSRCTPEQAAGASHQIAEGFDRWQALSTATTSDAQGQIVLTLDVVRVVPALAAAAQQWPDGLVRLETWLAPINR